MRTLFLIFQVGMDRIFGIRRNLAIFQPSGIRIPDIKNRISFLISGKPDINKTFLLLFEDLRCFNYLSNSVKQRTGIAPRSNFVIYFNLFRQKPIFCNQPRIPLSHVSCQFVRKLLNVDNFQHNKYFEHSSQKFCLKVKRNLMMT